MGNLFMNLLLFYEKRRSEITMAWIIFALASWIAVLLLVPLHYWKKSWIVGAVGMTVLYFIDSTLVKLGAFRFNYNGSMIFGLPLPYLISYLAGGMAFDYFRPQGSRWRRIGYIFATALFLLVLELIMLYIGAFRYIRWNIAMSALLNLGGFTILMWFAEWLNLKQNEGLRTKEQH